MCIKLVNCAEMHGQENVKKNQCSRFCRRQKSVATAWSPVAFRPARCLVNIPTELPMLQKNFKFVV